MRTALRPAKVHVNVDLNDVYRWSIVAATSGASAAHRRLSQGDQRHEAGAVRLHAQRGPLADGRGAVQPTRPGRRPCRVRGPAATQAGVWPAVVDVMREVGIDLSNKRPKKLLPEMQLHADWAITLACGAVCPYVPTTVEDWDIPDPAGKTVDEVRAIRDQTRASHLRSARAPHRRHPRRPHRPPAPTPATPARADRAVPGGSRDEVRTCADTVLAEFIDVARAIVRRHPRRAPGARVPRVGRLPDRGRRPGLTPWATAARVAGVFAPRERELFAAPRRAGVTASKRRPARRARAFLPGRPTSWTRSPSTRRKRRLAAQLRVTRRSSHRSNARTRRRSRPHLDELVQTSHAVAALARRLRGRPRSPPSAAAHAAARRLHPGAQAAVRVFREAGVVAAHTHEVGALVQDGESMSRVPDSPSCSARTRRRSSSCGGRTSSIGYRAARRRRPRRSVLDVISAKQR